MPPVVARVLLTRGLATAADVARFLNPSLSHLHDPSLLPDLDIGVDRLASAIESGEKICVHGDYDVDGVTSTALLVRTLRALKADVDYRLPHRHRGGYDIKPASVEEIAAAGASLIVTCDCGITACRTVQRASELGIDVVITDHHEPGDVLPRAVAVIDPKRADASYPFPELAGVGVAFKFAQGLVRKLGYDEERWQSRFVDLAALGTVGDVVPLLEENRSIVKHGLELMPRSKKVGLRTILKRTNLIGKPLTAYYLGYVLGPRINAVGRMDDPLTALELFLTRDEAHARALTEVMEAANAERRAEQQRILAEAMKQVESKHLPTTRALVLSREGWNSGVIGIVAGKISDAYGRPTVLISRDEAAGIGHGSARSGGTFNLIEGLRSCDEYLERYGGHALAAGLSLRLDNLSAFEERLNAIACEALTEEEIGPRLTVDAELAPEQITRELADLVARMEPFGTGNPEPLFVIRRLAVLERQRVGDGSHLRMRLQGEGCPPIDCIAFGMGGLAESMAIGQALDLCCNLRVNTFNGVSSVQLVAQSIAV